MRLLALLVAFLTPVAAWAQWELQPTATSATLQSVSAVSDEIAWAAGDASTVLRTSNGGAAWTICELPKTAKKLNFRSIEAISERQALVVSTGKGDLSRVYSTVDGCQTWKLVFTNPDATGAFRALHHITEKQVYLLGEPVDGKFAMYYSRDNGENWFDTQDPGLDSEKSEAAFSSVSGALRSSATTLLFGSRGATALYLHYTFANCSAAGVSGMCPIEWGRKEVALPRLNEQTEEFAFASRVQLNRTSGAMVPLLLAVCSSATPSAGCAAVSSDMGKSWQASVAPPKDSRAAIGYAAATGLWIAVGESGTDVSSDDGRTWRPAAPDGSGAPGQDGGWRAISLPFAVGEKGRIGKLRVAASKL